MRYAKEINGTTYRAIFLQKFNPKNFIFEK